MTDGHLCNNISLGSRHGANPGQFRAYSGGITWKRQHGGNIIEIDKGDITCVNWMKIPRQYQLGISTKGGLSYKFIGFYEQDVSNLTNFIQKTIGVTAEEKQLSVSGHNWGEVDIDGNMLRFMVGSKQAFELSLTGVAQTQLQGNTDINLELHIDDTIGTSEKESLAKLSFYVQYSGDESHSPAQVLQEKIMALADLSLSEEAVVTFEEITVLTPRGRYVVELYLSFLRLQGQTTDFKIQYTSIVQIFLLPKSHHPHTFVVITLYPPIGKGQTSYPHIVIQFRTEDDITKKLFISEELLTTKYKDKLNSSYKELKHDAFTKILCGLSGAKVTSPGSFQSSREAFQVKSSLKTEDGVIYPLEKGFFFLPKTPTLIFHDEIKYIKFERHGAGVSSMTRHYFDLLVKLKNDKEHLFKNIQRDEYHNLFQFIKEKGLKILNLGDAQPSSEVAAVLHDGDEDAVDPHLERIKNAAGKESDEEDDDFVPEKDDSGSPTDDSGEEHDASESQDEKEKDAGKATSFKGQKKARVEVGSKKKKIKKKKDPNAPKRAMSGFMFFSKAEKENPKNTPGRSPREGLLDKWKNITAEEKEPYEAMAQADVKRYRDEMAGYKSSSGSAINVDSGDDSDQR